MRAHDLKIQENVPLSDLTSLGVGGPARYLVEARSDTQIRAALEFYVDELFARSEPGNVLH
mgnify:CR=1 FL=1